MDGRAWKAAVHGVAEGRTRLSDFTFTFHFDALEKEMATRSSVLAWRILGTGEPGGLLSMGSHRVRHDWSDLAAVAAAAITITKWQLCDPEGCVKLTVLIISQCIRSDQISCLVMSDSSRPHESQCIHISIILLYTLNLHNVIWELYLNRARGKNKENMHTKLPSICLVNGSVKKNIQPPLANL